MIGSAFNDTLDGNDLRNQINGGDGDDFLDGQPGNDTLLGDAGNDTYFGDTGADRVSFAGSPQKVTVDLSLGFATGEGRRLASTDGIEIILGSAFNDNITGGPFGGGGTVNFLFVGKKGNDTLTGFSGNDTLKGGGGNDTLRGASVATTPCWARPATTASSVAAGPTSARVARATTPAQGGDQDELWEEGQPRRLRTPGSRASSARADRSSKARRTGPREGAGPFLSVVGRMGTASIGRQSIERLEHPYRVGRAHLVGLSEEGSEMQIRLRFRQRDTDAGWPGIGVSVAAAVLLLPLVVLLPPASAAVTCPITAGGVLTIDSRRRRLGHAFDRRWRHRRGNRRADCRLQRQTALRRSTLST